MVKNYVLTCLIVLCFPMSFLKGAETVSSLSTAISPLDRAKKGSLAGNLLLPDPFYQEKLPAILGPHFNAEGEYTTAFFAKPNHYHPFSNDPFVNSLWELCTGGLSQLQVGHYETMSPHLGASITEEIDEKGIHYTVQLQPNLFWQPLKACDFPHIDLSPGYFQKKPLCSQDFKFYVEMFKNAFVDLPKAVSLRQVYQDLQEIEIKDDQTFIVHWKLSDQTPHSIRLLTGQLRPLPQHIYGHWPNGEPIADEATSPFLMAQHFANHWARQHVFSCGPWVFESKDANRIELVRNSSFPHCFAALMEKLVFTYKSSAVSAWQSFKDGELSSHFLMPQQMSDYTRFLKSAVYQKQKKELGEIKALEYFLRQYYFIGWNQKHPLFKDEKVRRALSYAIDREKIIEHFLKGGAKALSGPFMPGSAAYNSKVAPTIFDPEQSKELLEKAGFKPGSLGILEKKEGGATYQMRFHLAYFAQNEQAQAICQFIATSYKEIGIECLLQPLNYAEVMDRIKNKNFDALYLAWGLKPPPEDPGPSWHSKGSERLGSSNFIGFEDQQVDGWLDELKYCQDPKRRSALTQAIHARIDALQPCTFLYIPKQVFLSRSYLKNVFIPKESEMITEATIAEPCPKIFYIQE